MNSKILLNAEALSQSYIPEKLLHREKELNAISACLKNSINSFIHGPLGSGKTLLVKKVIEASNAKAIYIDC